MKNSDLIWIYGRNYGPITRSDVILARIAVFAVKFTVLLILAFELLLLAIF